MASRRVPLASVPHAANSPFRNGTTTSGKRTRAQGDSGLGQPPSKKQILELKDENDENVDPKRRAGEAMPIPRPLKRRSQQYATRGRLPSSNQRIVCTRAMQRIWSRSANGSDTTGSSFPTSSSTSTMCQMMSAPRPSAKSNRSVREKRSSSVTKLPTWSRRVQYHRSLPLQAQRTRARTIPRSKRSLSRMLPPM
ncbi:hypothetical protein KC337_g63 [Hortaea werneckii]|nr:hypothetical protein KC337_g63 [Hortaea werneckii]